MKTKTLILLLTIFLIIDVITAVLYGKELKTDADQQKKTYEQGLWDGYNRTMKYINGQEFHVGDTLRIKVSTADSLLHTN